VVVSSSDVIAYTATVLDSITASGDTVVLTLLNTVQKKDPTGYVFFSLPRPQEVHSSQRINVSVMKLLIIVLEA
jgi:hypothetical protein